MVMVICRPNGGQKNLLSNGFRVYHRFEFKMNDDSGGGGLIPARGAEAPRRRPALANASATKSICQKIYLIKI